jgi:hypothetical protein
MLPIKGCNPEVNILFIGAYILKLLHEQRSKSIGLKILFNVAKEELSLSIDHIILALDWLYIISAIGHDETGVFINEID